ncbi:winged helix-turn-helix transcriptional regulator [Olivibacter ginsenosidimutans]|uniref:Winged helix-turn-helix transcriptional regulator n=1 Tax=Olivibacter ginsenosidimutans TaxID=1176537 RepID=A0ABP9BIL3_9SPHI
MENKHDQEDCSHTHLAIQDTLYVVSGKWKLVILSILVNDGAMRFGELSRKAGISPRILSKELQEMEMNKLVSRTVSNTRPITVTYGATEYADTLKEVIDAMIKWGKNHRKAIAAN